VSCAKYGYLYQGQWYAWQKKRRGTPALDLPPQVFVTYLENHDQVANTAFGRRLSQTAAPARLRALTALTLLGPGTPLLFQGQEYGSTRPFLYFADHKSELQEPINAGRLEFLSQFQSAKDPDVVAAIPRAIDERTFAQSKLDPAERDRRHEWLALHRDLLKLRRTDPVVNRAGRARPDGAVIGADALVLRYQGGDDGDRLLVINLGIDLELQSCSEPLLAPPLDAHWEVQWSSESPRYGGGGTPALGMHEMIWLPAQSAVLLRSMPGRPADGAETTSGRNDADEH
jgi:maltooligosyltrehalose trehalohydrolase